MQSFFFGEHTDEYTKTDRVVVLFSKDYVWCFLLRKVSPGESARALSPGMLCTCSPEGPAGDF